jgi:hypothetical protein
LTKSKAIIKVAKVRDSFGHFSCLLHLHFGGFTMAALTSYASMLFLMLGFQLTPADIHYDALSSDAPTQIEISSPSTGDGLEGSFTVTGWVDAACCTTVTVTISNACGTVVTATATPDQNGNWSVDITNLPAGNYTITASIPGGGSDSVDIMVAEVTMIPPPPPPGQ